MAVPLSRRSIVGRELYVESRTQIADGKGPGFAELHINRLETERVPTVGHPVWPHQSWRPCSVATWATGGATIT